MPPPTIVLRSGALCGLVGRPSVAHLFCMTRCDISVLSAGISMKIPHIGLIFTWVESELLKRFSGSRSEVKVRMRSNEIFWLRVSQSSKPFKGSSYWYRVRISMAVAVLCELTSDSMTLKTLLAMPIHTCMMNRGVYPPNSHDATLPPRLPPLRFPTFSSLPSPFTGVRGYDPRNFFFELQMLAGEF